MAFPTEADIVVIGAGHNSLVAAAYLARAGLEVVVVEANDTVGGNTRTEPLTVPLRTALTGGLDRLKAIVEAG